MAEFHDEVAVETKRQTRRAWWFVAGAFIFVFGVVLFAFLRDDPSIKDDSLMLPLRTKGAGPDNPLALFCRSVEKSDFKPHLEIFLKTNFTKRADAIAALRQLNSANSQIRASWYQLVATNPVGWRWPIGEEKFMVTDNFGYLGLVFPLGVQLPKTEIEMTVEEGRLDDALTLYNQMLLYSEGLTKAEGMLIHWLIAMTSHAITLSATEEIAVSPTIKVEQLVEMQKYLAQQEPELFTQQLKLSLQMDYAGGKNMTDKEVMTSLESLYAPGGEPWEKLFLKLYFKRNKTTNMELNEARKLFDALDQDPAAFILASKTCLESIKGNIAQDWRSLLNPNAAGIMVSLQSMNTCHTIYVRSVICLALHRMNEVMLGLRRFELEHKRLPDELSELVPTYLDAVPVDPFDNKPLRWHSKTLRLYSVGEDTVDDGGEIKDPGKPGVDVGYFYWWGEEGRKYREEQLTPDDDEEAASERLKRDAKGK